MFRSPPKAVGHISAVKDKPFIGYEYIMSQSNGKVNLFNRTCPHRFYPIGDQLGPTDNITCKLHGFKYDCNGKPVNQHPYKLNCQSYNLGKSGIVFKNFVEPQHEWVDCIAKETNLEYSHSYTGKSEGSWLWLTEIEADLLHVHKDGIHPWLATEYDVNKIHLENGNGWVYQKHHSGFWLFIFPYTFVEWAPGCLSLNSIFPGHKNSEWGYSWMTQIYYDPIVKQSDRDVFNRIDEVFIQDVKASEKQTVPYVPYSKAISPLEQQVQYFGEWFKDNVITNRGVL